MKDDLVIQQAAADAASPELLLLFHGVGSSPEDLIPLAQALAGARPGAWVVAVRAPQRSDLGRGWQWFSVQGVTDANRPARVAAAMPAFRAAVAAWQAHTGVPADGTTLVGFSQGAILSLESTQQAPAPLAGRVIALAGRFAQPPQTAPQGTRVHLMHGEQDAVLPIGLAVEAERQLRALGASVTLDRFEGLAHGIDGRVLATVLQRLAEA